jgi:hypothetical protein
MIDHLPHPEQVAIRLDDLSAAVQSIRVSGPVEEALERSTSSSSATGAELTASGGAGVEVRGALSASKARSAESTHRVTRSGTEQVYLNFGSIGISLAGLIQVLGTPRIWLLIDEWSELPVELQPYLADLIRRTVLPNGQITLKIGAIEHRSDFMIMRERGDYVGLELGAMSPRT